MHKYVTWTSVDMTSHNLVRRHAQENLQVLKSDDLMRHFHHKFFIVPNTGRTGVSLLLPFVSQAWPFRDRSSDLFNWSGRRGCPRLLSTGDNWSNGGALPCNTHYPLPEIGQWLVLLWSHLRVHVLIKFSSHSCKRKRLVKNKTKFKKINMDELDTYSLSPQSQYCAGRRQTNLDQGNKRQEFAVPLDRQNPRSSSCTQWPSQRSPCTCF